MKLRNVVLICTMIASAITSVALAQTAQTAPTISQQPISQIVAAGADVSFTVIASGNPTPTYQWQKDGSNVSGATNATLSINNVQANRAGSYRVVITNAAGSVTSSVATLAIQSIPAFTTQPSSQTVDVGAPVNFTAVATGSPSPSFQWMKNSVAITGATSSSYSIPSANAADQGSYSVTATNAAGSVTSNTAVLTVSAPPTIATQPANVTAKEGDPATFTVVATPGVPAATTYQWRKDGTDINGATAATYTIAATNRADRGNYTVVVANTVGSVTSNAAMLNVEYAPTITTQPTAVNGTLNQNAMLNVVVDANPVATYQWKQKNPISGVVANVTGATGGTLNFTPLLYRHRGEYSVVITNTIGTVESNKVLVTLPASDRGPASVDVLDMTNLKIDRTGGFE